MTWKNRQGGSWSAPTPKVRKNGAWSSIGGGGGGGGDLGTNYFLHEDAEGTSGIIPETGNWVPNYDEAVEYTSEAARVGSQCIRMHMDYDWDYNSASETGVKPIPKDPAWGALDDRNPPWGVYGVPFWHGWSLGLPTYWEPDNEVEQVFEFHRDQSDGSDPAAGSGEGKPVSCRITGNEMVFLNEWTEGSNVRRTWSDPVTISAGNWYDIVMNIEWSHKNHDYTGFMDIWVNGTQVMSYTGDTAAADTNEPRPPEYRIYKWMWYYGATNTNTRTYYFDEMRYADGDATYEDVVPGVR